MSLLRDDSNAEVQRIAELERKAKLAKERLDKQLTKQKILLGVFLLDMLENKSVAQLNEFAANNFDNFLTRDEDKKLMAGFIKNLKISVSNSTPDMPSVNTPNMP